MRATVLYVLAGLALAAGLAASMAVPALLVGGGEELGAPPRPVKPRPRIVVVGDVVTKSPAGRRAKPASPPPALTVAAAGAPIVTVTTKHGTTVLVKRKRRTTVVVATSRKLTGETARPKPAQRPYPKRRELESVEQPDGASADE